MSHVSSSIVLIICMLCAACTDAAKTSKPPTVSADTCERLDTCNILQGSVEECIQETDTSLNMLPKNQRAEVELALKQCLGHPSCDGLVVCLADAFDVGAILQGSPAGVSVEPLSDRM